MRKIDFPKITPYILIYAGIPALVFGLLAWGVTSCTAAYKSRAVKEATLPERTFTLPDVPVMLTDHPAERANYAALHYWDHFDFSDTVYVHLPEVTEQAFADFLNILSYTEYGNAVTAINGVLTQAEQEASGRMYGYFLDLFNTYLHDPNSPYRNDEFYIPVAEYILSDSRSGELERMRPASELEKMLKNRVGEAANDIVYTLADGNTGHLYDIRADYTLLYFNNPDCYACEKVAEALKGSAVINGLLDDGTLTVLAVCPDEDISAWERYSDKIPADWINGYDKEKAITMNHLYDLRAIPSLYLLDRDKRVVLKDVDFNVLNLWLGDRFASPATNDSRS